MEAAFGKDRKERKHNNFKDIKIGDMLRMNNNTHSAIVIGKDNKQLTFAEARSALTYVLTSYP